MNEEQPKEPKLIFACGCNFNTGERCHEGRRLSLEYRDVSTLTTNLPLGEQMARMDAAWGAVLRHYKEQG